MSKTLSIRSNECKFQRKLEELVIPITTSVSSLRLWVVVHHPVPSMMIWGQGSVNKQIKLSNRMFNKQSTRNQITRGYLLQDTLSNSSENAPVCYLCLGRISSAPSTGTLCSRFLWLHKPHTLQAQYAVRFNALSLQSAKDCLIKIYPEIWSIWREVGAR
jgi:hypothetical protein